MMEGLSTSRITYNNTTTNSSGVKDMRGSMCIVAIKDSRTRRQTSRVNTIRDRGNIIHLDRCLNQLIIMQLLTFSCHSLSCWMSSLSMPMTMRCPEGTTMSNTRTKAWAIKFQGSKQEGSSKTKEEGRQTTHSIIMIKDSRTILTIRTTSDLLVTMEAINTNAMPADISTTRTCTELSTPNSWRTLRPAGSDATDPTNTPDPNLTTNSTLPNTLDSTHIHKINWTTMIASSPTTLKSCHNNSAQHKIWDRHYNTLETTWDQWSTAWIMPGNINNNSQVATSSSRWQQLLEEVSRRCNTTPKEAITIWDIIATITIKIETRAPPSFTKMNTKVYITSSIYIQKASTTCIENPKMEWFL